MQGPAPRAARRRRRRMGLCRQSKGPRAAAAARQGRGSVHAPCSIVPLVALAASQRDHDDGTATAAQQRSELAVHLSERRRRSSSSGSERVWEQVVGSAARRQVPAATSHGTPLAAQVAASVRAAAEFCALSQSARIAHRAAKREEAKAPDGRASCLGGEGRGRSHVRVHGAS